MIDARIAELRARLAANVGELQQRVTRARTLLSPRTYLDNPWVRLGLGAAVGYLAGRRRKPRLLTDGGASPGSESLVHAVLRSTVMTLAASMIQRAINSTNPSDDDPQD